MQVSGIPNCARGLKHDVAVGVVFVDPDELLDPLVFVDPLEEPDDPFEPEEVEAAETLNESGGAFTPPTDHVSTQLPIVG